MRRGSTRGGIVRRSSGCNSVGLPVSDLTIGGFGTTSIGRSMRRSPRKMGGD